MSTQNLLEITEEFSEAIKFKINKKSQLSKIREKTNMAGLLPEFESVISRKNFHALVEDIPQLPLICFPVALVALLQRLLQPCHALQPCHPTMMLLSGKEVHG